MQYSKRALPKDPPHFASFVACFAFCLPPSLVFFVSACLRDFVVKILMRPTAKAKTPEPPDKRRLFPEKFQLLVPCKDESDQKRLFEKLVALGYLPRVLVM